MSHRSALSGFVLLVYCDERCRRRLGRRGLRPFVESGHNIRPDAREGVRRLWLRLRAGDHDVGRVAIPDAEGDQLLAAENLELARERSEPCPNSGRIGVEQLSRNAKVGLLVVQIVSLMKFEDAVWINADIRQA